MSLMSSPAKHRRRTSRRKPAQEPQSLLILHLDAGKLRADGLHLGEVASFSATLSATALGASVEVQDVTTQASLLALFARFAEQERTFDVIVAVAHSDEAGIQIASDRTASWPEFAHG
jgi:hypothetical protein